MQIRIIASVLALTAGLASGAAVAQTAPSSSPMGFATSDNQYGAAMSAWRMKQMQEGRQSVRDYVHNPNTEAAASFQDSFVTNDKN